MYRGKPFWAWNGRLEPEELRRQIRVFRRMGFGGFFMHSRVGLDTEYLGKEWFDCVRACIDEAAGPGMEAWLYDEDRWPSGAAGGFVTRNPRYRQRSLVMDRYDSPQDFEWTDDIAAAFTAKIDGKTATRVKRLEERGRSGAGPAGSVLAFRVEVAKPSPWYNGQTYLDTMNDEAVREFIRVTHSAYAAEIAEHFRHIVPGIFTDEPNYGAISTGRLPWTGRLPAVFRERYGYDLIPYLVELMFHVDGREVSRARYHYHDCITHLFTDAFARQIGEWCEENDLLHTGHVLGEESLVSQTTVTGSAMRFYEHMQAPGIDILTEHRRELNTAVQCASAANQFGRKWRLSELYGCTGWDFSFEAHKASGDWQAACGINLRCPHLSWYTMLGQAKRDYPASIAFQSPWWELYETVEGYFARVHAAMSRGREVRDLLVIHPVESMWAIRHDGWREDRRVRQCDRMFNGIASTLTRKHIGFDYGDEEILSRRAVVAGSGREAALKVALATYRAVLVPPLVTIRSSTLKLLRSFHEAGGLVVFAGEPPGYVDAVPSEEPSELARDCLRVPSVEDGAVEALSERCRRVSIAGPDGSELENAMYLLKEDDDAFYLFAANTGHVPEVWNDDPLVRDRRTSYPEAFISGFEGCKGAPLELDPETGDIFAADAARVSGAWRISTSLPRIAGRLFLMPKAAGKPEAARRPQLSTVSEQELNPGRWPVTLSEDNCLVLDRPQYMIGDGGWRKAENILRVDCAVRDALGIDYRGGNMVQPWVRDKKGAESGTPVRLRYEFQADYMPRSGLKLAIERPEVFDIKINGNPVCSETASGWWVDMSLQTLPVDPALLRTGTNELTLQLVYTGDFSGLETIYLLGDFGVSVSGTSVSLIPPPSTLAPGDWCEQGLSFYAGSVCYRHRFEPDPPGPGERVLVRTDGYRGVAVRVLVNGRIAGISAWEPNEVDITDMLPDDGAGIELGIEVIGHRRNSHGPLHISEKWPDWTGPAEFVTSGERWHEGYQLVPAGLMSAPLLVVRR